MSSEYRALAPTLTERSRRVWVATEGRVPGRGGMALVARATGISISTIARGLSELRSRDRLPPGRVRRPDRGRKRTIDKEPRWCAIWRGRWSRLPQGRRPRRSAGPRRARGPWRRPCRAWATASAINWCENLGGAGYSLQANRKTREGPTHPNRGAQFHHISAQVRHFQAAGQPVISVDTTKKELVGDFKNAGPTWRRTGQPETVRVHDFLIPTQGKACPTECTTSPAMPAG